MNFIYRSQGNLPEKGRIGGYPQESFLSVRHLHVKVMKLRSRGFLVTCLYIFHEGESTEATRETMPSHQRPGETDDVERMSE